MKFKYKQPIQILLIFEKINSYIWNSKKLNYNHSIILLPVNWISAINLCLNNELFLSTNSLIESSAIDTSNYKLVMNNNNVIKLFLNNNFIIYYNYFNYSLKSKLTIFFILNKYKKKLNSIDKIFINANWLERELSEMYGLNYSWKTDTRKLLLDYIKIESPLLKNYQSEGYQDIFYSLIDNQILAVQNEVIEL
uniref:NADH dehydrogenase subunit 9 n=1 Tax=Ichthyophthirius multifiliis TaxID=5932 RepID=G1FLD3_ICHMU|nr:NADH dehydrogenase subunit 9 [Ichthyophthirius multifiliis]AEL89275.1 NADH dehydrogenase subunit 9 [Ichthyophthirius multifiliis]